MHGLEGTKEKGEVIMIFSCQPDDAGRAREHSSAMAEPLEILKLS